MECQYQPHLAVSEKDGLGCCSSSSSQLSRRDCRVVEVEMEVGSSHGCREGGREGGGGGSHGPGGCRNAAASLISETADPGGRNTAQLPFSKELITFSLFGKMPAKHSKQVI